MAVSPWSRIEQDRTAIFKATLLQLHLFAAAIAATNVRCITRSRISWRHFVIPSCSIAVFDQLFRLMRLRTQLSGLVE